jgi:peptide/nickel transport system ATP-binding protein
MIDKNKNDNNVLLEVDNLSKHFEIKKGVFRKVTGKVKAVDNVTFHLEQGKTLALVGESGCGKTTTGRLILRALRPTTGRISFNANGAPVDIAGINENELRPFRKHMQLIFQDPYTSLNPRMTILEIIGEPLIVNGILKGKQLEDRVAELLELVGLNSKYLRRYPHAFSGGQRQRIGIARALALNPELIVADEPVSALDVSVQAQILNLLKDIQEKLKLSYLFISHDLSVVKFISDRIAVMYVGQVVELTDTETLFNRPKHPYTEALLSSVPRIKSDKSKERYYLSGDVADPANPPAGCYFHPRCRYVTDICRTKSVSFEKISNGHYVRCHLADKLDLNGLSYD